MLTSRMVDAVALATTGSPFEVRDLIDGSRMIEESDSFAVQKRQQIQVQARAGKFTVPVLASGLFKCLTGPRRGITVTIRFPEAVSAKQLNEFIGDSDWIKRCKDFAQGVNDNGPTLQMT